MAELSKRRRAGVIAIAVLVPAVAVFVDSRGSDSADEPGARDDLNVGALAKPATIPDPVPKGPFIKEYPERCGVSAATAQRLVPGSKPSGRESGPFANRSKGACSWYSLNDGEEKGDWVPNTTRLRKQRSLRVTIAAETASTSASAVGMALQRTDPAAVINPLSDKPARLVTGLGDEAAASYSPGVDAGATVNFRVGSAVVSITYRGWDREGKDPAMRPLPERTALDGALRAASETASHLGVPAQSAPKLAAPVTGVAPVGWNPKPCDMVSAGTLRKVANGATREGMRSEFFARTPGAKSAACSWNASTPSPSTHDSSRHLTVEVAAAPDWQPGMGERLATREYLRNHHDARDSERDDKFNQQREFTALRGLGDQAFTIYGEHSSGDLAPGRVMFRAGNVLVRVSYRSDSRDDDPLTESDAINGAYTVALDVAKSLRGSR